MGSREEELAPPLVGVPDTIGFVGCVNSTAAAADLTGCCLFCRILGGGGGNDELDIELTVVIDAVPEEYDDQVDEVDEDESSFTTVTG